MIYTIAAILIIIILYSIFKDRIELFYYQVLGFSQVEYLRKLKKYYEYHMI
jgi:hypothetical protein